ncbi:MAG: replicative DNA helicase [Eubacterium sp.]|nr:replicative DNA helicase [Eubacterium sp.]
MEENENLLMRNPPNDINAEYSVLGSILIDNEVLPDVCDILKASDFYNPMCQHIFHAVCELYREAAPVDPVTLNAKLTSLGAPAGAKSPELMAAIIGAVPTSTNVGEYVKIVRDKSYLRQLISASENIANAGYQDEESSEALLQQAEADIFKLSESFGTSGHNDGSIYDIMMSTLSEIEAAAAAGSRITGISTGFKYLDNQIAGLQPSDLILIAARPSMGKTAFALNIAEYAALKKGVPTAIFSLEMSANQLAKRLLSMNSHVDSQKIRTGELSFDDWKNISESANMFAKSKLFIDDTPGITLTQFRTKCRKLKAQHDIKLVFIDYLQLMVGEGRTSGRQEEISNISRGIKAIAREIQCPIVALSQLSRAPEARNDKRPMLSDLRESGAIEQDADVVMFLYRDDYYNEDSEDKGITEVIIGKQRNGPIGKIKLRWLNDLTKFANLEYKKENNE